jgi:hypothetical protein
MRLLLPEIFDRVEKAATVEERKKILLQNNNPVLQDVLRFNFHPQAKANLPEGAPPYKREQDIPLGYSASNLYKEARKFYIWYQPTNLNKIKLETLFIQLLECIHWQEADIVIAMKDKKLSTIYKNVTEDLIREVYPQMLPPRDQMPVQEASVTEEPKRKRGRPAKAKTETVTEQV